MLLPLRFLESGRCDISALVVVFLLSVLCDDLSDVSDCVTASICVNGPRARPLVEVHDRYIAADVASPSGDAIRRSRLLKGGLTGLPGGQENLFLPGRDFPRR